MLTCQRCTHQNPDASRFCEACGVTLHDPAVAEQHADEIEASFRLDQVKKARTAFIVVAVLQVVAGFLGSAMAGPDEAGLILVSELILATVFFGLAFWASKQPFAAAIVGLFLYAGLHLLAAIGDPSTIYKGIIIKVIVVGMLVRAIKAGFEYRQFVRSRGMG